MSSSPHYRRNLSHTPPATESDRDSQQSTPPTDAVAAAVAAARDGAMKTDLCFLSCVWQPPGLFGRNDSGDLCRRLLLTDESRVSVLT